METGDLQTHYATNAIDLQNVQNQNIVQDHSTWVDWGFSYYTTGRIFKNVYELSKVVSPVQTVRQIATYTVGPLTRRLDKITGLGGSYLPLPYGYGIPCSFSTLGTVATETLTATMSPAQWAASKAVNYVSGVLSSQLTSGFDLENRGWLGREAAAVVRISGSLIAQKTLAEVEKREVVTSAYKKIDEPLKVVSKPIDGFVTKGILNGLGRMGVSTTQPLGLTNADIELERRLVTSESKIKNIEGKIDELRTKENEIHEQIVKQGKSSDEINQDADKKIRSARKYEKSCPEKKSMHKYEKHRKYNKVWAEKISEDFVSEYNISEQQRSEIRNDIVRHLHHKSGKEDTNRAMREVIVKHETILQNKSKMLLDDVRRAQTNTECKLGKAKQQYESEKDKFYAGTNSYQQAKYKTEQQERIKLKFNESLTIADICSGNVQLTISPQDLEDRLNKHLEEQNYSKRNLNDRKHKVFVNGKIKISRDSMGNLGLEVPIKIDNKRENLSKVTQINADLYFNVLLSDSSPDKILGASIVDATHRLSKKPHFQLFSTFELMRVGGLASDIVEPALNQQIRDFQADLDNFLFRDNILNKFNQNLPEGVTVQPGAVNVRSRVGNNDSHVFDIDCNADVQCEIPLGLLKDNFKGYEVAGCRFEKISNIQMTDGRMELEIPLTGTLNGSIVSSFDLKYCSEQQRLTFGNLNVTPQDNASPLLKISTSTANCLQGVLSGHLEGYINNNLENVRLLAMDYAQQRLQREIPSGTLNLDPDSIAINKINFDNGITLDASLRSNM